MSRTFTKDAPPKASGGNPHPHSIERAYTLQLMTPLFGGGVDAGTNDPITLIRPSSIRGQLRFWWRATRGAAYAAAGELRAREAEIWGSTENPSPISIEVVSPRSHERRAPADDFGFGKFGPEAYALFAAKQNDNELCKEGPSFTLTVHWLQVERLQELREIENRRRIRLELKSLPPTVEDIGPDIEAAIWAWFNFGGIGARTRRGCGALRCVSALPNEGDIHPPSAEKFAEWLNARLLRHGISRPAAPRPWSAFFRTIFLKSAGQDALGSWKHAIQLLKDFRQGESRPGVRLGRDKGTTSKRPGRSRWTEPEAIRELILSQRGLTARPAKWHPKDTRMPIAFFPRAELGMPIVFEIRDEVVPGATSKKGKPPNIKPTLQFDEDSDRMASPIILRPIRFADGKCAALMGVLTTKSLQSALLRHGDGDLQNDFQISAAHIRNPALVSYADSPLSGRTLGSTGSALEAFESFAAEPHQGYKKVFP